MVEFFQKKNRHRTIIGVCFILCVIVPLLLFCSINIREWAFLDFLPEDHIIVQLLNESGCFYDEKTDVYGMKGIPIGSDIWNVASSLEIENWIDIDDSSVGVALTTVHIKAFGSVYYPTIHAPEEQVCTNIAFEASLMQSANGIPTRSYLRACDYVDDLFQLFMVEYGEPNETNFGAYNLRDVAQNERSDNLYAIWVSEKGETQLTLRAYKIVYNYTKTETDLIVRITTGMVDDNMYW